jgi:hypothetical protein
MTLGKIIGYFVQDDVGQDYLTLEKRECQSIAGHLTVDGVSTVRVGLLLAAEEFGREKVWGSKTPHADTEVGVCRRLVSSIPRSLHRCRSSLTR